MEVQVGNAVPDFATLQTNVFEYLTVQLIAIICQILGVWFVKYAFLAFFWKLGPRDGVSHQKRIWSCAFAYTTIALIVTLALPPWQCFAVSQDFVELASTLSVAQNFHSFMLSRTSAM